MADRATLHLTQVEALAEYACERGWTRDQDLGDFQILKLRHSDGRVAVYYKKLDASEHATVPNDGVSDRLLKKWMELRQAARSVRFDRSGMFGRGPFGG